MFLKLQSQKVAQTPFTFALTGIRVYTFEEAIYHSFHYFQKSLEDIFSPAFIQFVDIELGLSQLAKKIQSIALLDTYEEKIGSFLSLTLQFSNEEIQRVKKEVRELENRQEWEKLLELANLYMEQELFHEAIYVYEKALDISNDFRIIYNLSIGLLQIGQYEKSLTCLEIAEKEDVSPLQKEAILLAKIESYIQLENFELATTFLEEAEDSAKKALLTSLLSEKTGDIQKSVRILETAHAKEYNKDVFYALADAYIKTRQYDKALDFIQRSDIKDTNFYKLEGKIFAAMQHFSAAISSIKKAIAKEPKNSQLWMILAAYHREHYQLDEAKTAILNAESLQPDDLFIQLEKAKITKAAGDIKTYQDIIDDILSSLATDYRELLEKV